TPAPFIPMQCFKNGIEVGCSFQAEQDPRPGPFGLVFVAEFRLLWRFFFGRDGNHWDGLIRAKRLRGYARNLLAAEREFCRPFGSMMGPAAGRNTDAALTDQRCCQNRLP
ncbi:MAG: hypothetical protein OXC63_13240, partial [Aestuariivita sp.]|nr:hypothetical protein [Aestuariivita sp.]MCY4348154.1 hypothetical protein [Aestuariivita sp.]